MPRTRLAPPLVAVATLAGLAWAQLCLALTVLVIPSYLALGPAVAGHGAYHVARWSALLPVTLASALTGTLSAPGSTFPSAITCSLIAVALSAAIAAALAGPHRRIATVLVGVGVALALVSAGITARELHRLRVAERSFLALMGRTASAHDDSGVVRECRRFVSAYPDSRWVGEAMRVVAMAEWDARRYRSASAWWAQFESRFEDPVAPGVAFAEHSQALCARQLGLSAEERRHLLAAVAVIRARGDGIQAWIARDDAARLGELDRTVGRYALANYWDALSDSVHVD